MHNDQIIIFTDGSSRGNPGPGGWGAIIVYPEQSRMGNKKVKELGGREDHTTNNRMEMTAALSALTYIQEQKISGSITVNTDSSYLINGITKWVKGWAKNNWRTATKEPVVNQDIWEKLVDVVDALETQSDITWSYLKGHSGIPGNERCDEIATAMADLPAEVLAKEGEKAIALYDGDKQHYPVDLSVTIGRTLGSQTSAEKKERAKLKAYSYLSLVNGTLEKHQTWAQCEARVKGVKGAKFKKSISADDEAAIIKEWGI